mmetsp:Transcript_58508/g.166463  ORF Transcript_58508/g.166463 Transcript_58508/m.166463 type:complete len:323 (-) Transcript_58508:137-1105(-)
MGTDDEHPHLRAHDARRQGGRGGGPDVPGPHLRHGRRRGQRLRRPPRRPRRHGPEQRHRGDGGGPLYHQPRLSGAHRRHLSRGSRRARDLLRRLQVLRALRAAELVVQVRDLLLRNLADDGRQLLPGHRRLPLPLLRHDAREARAHARGRPAHVLAVLGLHDGFGSRHVDHQHRLLAGRLHDRDIARRLREVPGASGADHAVVEAEPQLGEHLRILLLLVPVFLVRAGLLLRPPLPSGLVPERAALCARVGRTRLPEHYAPRAPEQPHSAVPHRSRAGGGARALDSVGPMSADALQPAAAGVHNDRGVPVRKWLLGESDRPG